jgi:hypothetical protein
MLASSTASFTAEFISHEHVYLLSFAPGHRASAESYEQPSGHEALPSLQCGLSQSLPRRVYSAPTRLQQQEQQQVLGGYQQQMQPMSGDHAAAFVQHYKETYKKALAVADSTYRIEELVHIMEKTHVDHQSRVSDPEGVGADPDPITELLGQIADLQVDLPAPPGRPHFYAVPRGMLEQWTVEIEQLEAALGGPHSRPYAAVSGTKAQLVCDRLRAIWNGLEDAPDGLPFLQVLLLSKKLRCIDALRPNVVENSRGPAIPWQLMELRALLVQVAEHDHMWYYMLRWPFSYFESGRRKLTERAASHYADAALAAYPDVCQQVRLLVEQCKVLQRAGKLQDAQHLDAVALHYPEATLRQLHDFHIQHPDAGPPIDQDIMHFYDTRSNSDWNEECAAAEAHAAELEWVLQLDMAAGTSATTMTIEEQQQQAAQARYEADVMAARPPTFAAAKNKSLMFFHSDKRTGRPEEDQEFVKVKEAWTLLSDCRLHFERLRAYQEQLLAAAQS